MLVDILNTYTYVKHILVKYFDNSNGSYKIYVYEMYIKEVPAIGFCLYRSQIKVFDIYLAFHTLRK